MGLLLFALPVIRACHLQLSENYQLGAYFGLEPHGTSRFSAS